MSEFTPGPHEKEPSFKRPEADEDRVVDQATEIANYSFEMVDARNEIAGHLLEVKEQLVAADARGDLPSRVGVHRFENGATVIDLNKLSDDPREALGEHQEDKAMRAMAAQFGETVTGDNVLITYNDDEQAPSDPKMPVIEQPVLKVEWFDQEESGPYSHDTASDSLSFYRSGYVEARSEVTRHELVHRDDVPEETRRHMMPSVNRQVDVVPLSTRPAELADLQNAASVVDTALTRRGLKSFEN